MPNFTFYWGRKKNKDKLFPDEFAYLWQNKRPVIIAKKFERMRIHFSLKSDVLTAVTVVVPWTWGIGAWREKNGFGLCTRLFRSRCLKSLLFLLGEGNMSRGIWRGRKYILHFLVTVISYCFSSVLPCYNQSRHQLFRQWFIIRGHVIYSPKKNKGNRAKWKINGFNEFELFRSLDGFALHLGSFSNDHGDGNDNGKKAIG